MPKRKSPEETCVICMCKPSSNGSRLLPTNFVASVSSNGPKQTPALYAEKIYK